MCVSSAWVPVLSNGTWGKLLKPWKFQYPYLKKRSYHNNNKNYFIGLFWRLNEKAHNDYLEQSEQPQWPSVSSCRVVLLPAAVGREVLRTLPAQSFLFYSLGISQLLCCWPSWPNLFMMSSPLDWEHIRARHHVSYRKLGFAAVINGPQSSGASKCKGLFLPPFACLSWVGSGSAPCHLHPGTWQMEETLCGTLPVSWQGGGNKKAEWIMCWR